MNIHEYQAKALLKQFSVPVPEGYLALSPIEAEFAMIRLGTPKAIVKAQIHSGGRGKAGGIKIANSTEECKQIAQNLLGSTLVTNQTGPHGKIVRKLYIESPCEIQKEYYLSLLVDRETASIVIMFSTEGGMDIEEVAKMFPDKITKIFIDPTIGLKDYHIRKILFNLNLSSSISKELFPIIKNLYQMFLQYDCSLVEINPLVLTTEHKFLALDCKINFDDNALFKHKEIDALRDFEEQDLREIEASKYNLNYIGLDGDIGCLVNGAGLAMATMDIIKYYGGKPANFLDVGGSATEDMVTNAFRIILQDTNVKAVFVNIFGGIMKCDIIANGLVLAASRLGIRVPIIVRLEGTNVDRGKKILESSGYNFIFALNMADGAMKAVEAVKQNIK